MNINEDIRWSDSIYQIMRNDRVEGGKGGIANIQAEQLAARTQYLKTMIEGYSDYHEYTFYTSVDDPDGTIAGLEKTPTGKLFRVARGPGGKIAFSYYLNDSGVAKKIADTTSRGALTNNIREYSSAEDAQSDVEDALILEGAKCYISDSETALSVEYVNNNGVLIATGRAIPLKSQIDELDVIISGKELDRVDLSPESLGGGKYYRIDTGEIDITSDQNWSACAPVNVAGFKRLIITGTFLRRGNAAPVVFLDENSGVVSVESMGLPLSADNNFKSVAEYQVSIPVKAVSAVISTYAEKTVIVYGASSEFKKSAVAMSAGSVRSRLVNWVKNTFMSATTGAIVTNPDDYYTARIPVSPGDTFILSCKLKGQSNQVRLVGFLDASDALIGSFCPGPGSTTVATISNLSFRVPANAVAMIITAYAVDASTVLLQAAVFGRSVTDAQTAIDAASSIVKHTSLPYYPGRYWRNTDGALMSVADELYCAFHPIKVNPGDVYRIKSNSLTGNPSLVSLIVFKGPNGEFIGASKAAPGSSSFVSVDTTVTVPAGAALMLLTAHSPYIDVAAQGSAVEKLTSSVAGIASAIAEQLKIGFTKGYYWNPTSGALTGTTDPNWRACDAVAVSPGENYRIIATEFSGSIYLVVFKDAGGAVVGKSQLGPGGAAIVSVDVPVTVPAGAVSMCISAYTDKVTIIKNVNHKADLRNNLIKNDFETGLELLSPKGLDGYYWHQKTGVRTLITSDWSYFSVDPLAVKEGETYRIICAEFSGNPSNVYLVLFKDAAGSVIGRSYAGPGSGVLQSVDVNVTVPAAAVTMCITGHSRNMQVIKAGSILSKLPGNSPTQGNGPLDYWKGKKIVWLGTSIPAGSGTNAYPYMLAKSLGATVANMSVGSSPLRGGLDSFASTDDPYGWTGSSYTRVTRALSHSIAIKQAFIDNYDSKWKSLLNGGPDALSDSDKAAILSYSYENRLAGNLDADLFVIDHGINDYLWLQERGGNVASLLTPAVDTRNINSFYGGMNVVIDYILSQNPRARILLIGFYENNLRKEIAEVQQRSAALWQYPLVRMWEKTGWSQQVLSGANGAGKTITEFWLPDNLHPHKDSTGQANSLLASIIESAIREVR
ncbi:SGNH/GDSL hydrolase family protein [Klebsiella pneumoniae]|uniref:SGNH/GDSL hydrolase family protein n=1 Tax=Klebsiella pneumoniae TaxID=573 RepID=UPI00292BB1DC|nr:SGNH/GDSL hydrolase family protein [Klebsiella pneumoniae]MDV1148087.1 SGNH/GDSL hydrolase family protein [Klebsiella pneumoniae]MDV1195194.1 SGNH/GDSL hydrolase family protein [Klebsiella pneumoniae]MDV1236230.1 SGNH/GDSL hydrolase family protein [Klebsiella pneumoniae]MDV1261618.1 SGNH/GDSL hydrolase family protein [Klebsiella pneumoniae]MDV1918304.1 SGNH/GDSL hydrolase family protein [Klebsiella pneumoniae]